MEHAHTLEHRINELEIKAAFTEDLLDQLNMTIYQQRQQIDALAQQLARMKEQAADAGSGASRHLRDELPPHY